MSRHSPRIHPRISRVPSEIPTFKKSRGDCFPDHRPPLALPPNPPRIHEIVTEATGDEQCHVSWFYRPEEARGGRKAFHGEKELFTSDHYDWVAKSSINGHCAVHKLKEYQMLKEVTDNDYYTRFSYKASKGEFKPDRVPVYCACEMPYNPDLFMVECEACEEWYHPQCVGSTKKQVSLF